MEMLKKIFSKKEKKKEDSDSSFNWWEVEDRYYPFQDGDWDDDDPYDDPYDMFDD